MTDTAQPTSTRFTPEWYAEMEQRHADRLAATENAWRELSTEKGWSFDAKCRSCGDLGAGSNGTTYCGCEAGHRRKRADAHEDSWRILLPPRFRDYRLDGSPCAEARDAAKVWFDGGGWSRGDNLIFMGPVGTGKTGLLIGLTRLVHETDAPWQFVGVPMMLDKMRPGSDEDPMDKLIRIKVLALDDLGVEKPSEWVRERLYVLVNGRYEAQRSTLVTTNCNLGELAAAIGERTVSRLQEGATIVAVKGADRRRP